MLQMNLPPCPAAILAFPCRGPAVNAAAAEYYPAFFGISHQRFSRQSVDNGNNVAGFTLGTQSFLPGFHALYGRKMKK